MSRSENPAMKHQTTNILEQHLELRSIPFDVRLDGVRRGLSSDL